MYAFCQRCGKREHDWTVRQAEVSVGPLKHWKVQLCEPCTAHVTEVLRVALTGTEPSQERPRG